MKLVVGLGNPGELYAHSRHNIGFLIVKHLAKLERIPLLKEARSFSLAGKGKVCGESVLAAIPLTFMNLSGFAVKALLKKYRIQLGNLLVVCDDLDLGFGRLKIKPHGSSGGHRGLQSIIDCIASDEFCRLRIGLGRPPKNKDASAYVLSAFNQREKKELTGLIDEATDCVRTWLSNGINKGMNIFNQRSK